MIERISEIPEDVHIQKQLTDMHIKEWLQNDVLHLRWWLLIILIIAILSIWWINLDKSRFLEISLFVVLSTILFMGINEYGEELTLWDFPTDIIPIFPPLFSINALSLPLLYSLIYQHFSIRKAYIYSVILASAFISFFIEPLLSLIGFYHLIHWNYFSNFILYIVVMTSVRDVVIKIYSIAGKNRT